MQGSTRRRESLPVAIAIRCCATAYRRAPVDPCISEAVRYYAPKLWRRPVSEEEVARHAAIAEAAGDGAENAELGLRYVLASLLHAPSFVYLAQRR